MYRNESQIENKKTSGKRKASAIADSAKKAPPAKKQKTNKSTKVREKYADKFSFIRMKKKIVMYCLVTTQFDVITEIASEKRC